MHLLLLIAAVRFANVARLPYRYRYRCYLADTVLRCYLPDTVLSCYLADTVLRRYLADTVTTAAATPLPPPPPSREPLRFSKFQKKRTPVYIN